jgi:hypothetical protein
MPPVWADVKYTQARHHQRQTAAVADRRIGLRLVPLSLGVEVADSQPRYLIVVGVTSDRPSTV